MNAHEMGSLDWWLTIKTMPAEEALFYLHSYKASLLELTHGTAAYAAASYRLSRVNAELKRNNRLISDSEWRKVCRDVLPPELFEMVVVEKRRRETLRPDDISELSSNVRMTLRGDFLDADNAERISSLKTRASN